jgi:hypothetical protein
MPTMKSVQTAAPGTVQIAESEETFAGEPDPRSRPGCRGWRRGKQAGYGNRHNVRTGETL